MGLVNGTFGIIKTKDSDLDYTIDWSAWLQGDVIVESTWEVPSDSLATTHDGSVNESRTKATIWVLGGKGQFGVKNTVVTGNVPPRTDSRTIAFTVVDR